MSADKTIRTACPGCGAEVRETVAVRGVTIPLTCPACGHAFTFSLIAPVPNVEKARERAKWEVRPDPPARPRPAAMSLDSAADLPPPDEWAAPAAPPPRRPAGDEDDEPRSRVWLGLLLGVLAFAVVAVPVGLVLKPFIMARLDKKPDVTQPSGSGPAANADPATADESPDAAPPPPPPGGEAAPHPADLPPGEPAPADPLRPPRPPGN